MNNALRIVTLLIIVFGAFYALFNYASHNKNQRDSQLYAKIVEVDHGYGYHILIGKKLLVKQEFIPAVAGEIPFHTPKDAKKVADLVKEKLTNKSNPEVSLEELTNLNIITLKR